MNYRHTWHIDADSRVLRLYLWAWAGDPSCVTFCKLFWGYVFLPVNLFGRAIWLVLWPIRRPLSRVDWNVPPPPPKPKPKPKRDREEIPGRIAEFFARPLPRRIAKLIGFALLALGAAAVIGSLVWLAPRFVDWFLHTKAWEVAAIVVGSALFIVFLIWLDDRFKIDARLTARRERKEKERDPDRVTLGDVLVQGAKAVKSNTCPKIEVRERGTS